MRDDVWTLVVSAILAGIFAGMFVVWLLKIHRKIAEKRIPRQVGDFLRRLG
jgi:fructose-specific phosphotransferase system IIC component